MIVAQTGMDTGLLLSAIGIFLSLLGIITSIIVFTYKAGGKITDFENTLDNRLADISQVSERNTKELRDISESLTKIEVYSAQNSNRNNANNSDDSETNGGSVRNDGGSVTKSQESGDEETSRVDKFQSNQGREIHSNSVNISGYVYILEVEERATLFHVTLSPAKRLAYLHPTKNDFRKLERKLMTAMGDVVPNKVDVKVDRPEISIILNTTEPDIINEAMEVLFEFLSDNPPTLATWDNGSDNDSTDDLSSKMDFKDSDETNGNSTE